MAEAIIFGPQRFIDRTFDDALSLLEEVRSYILYEERSDRMDLPPAARVRQSLEATRMTARLTNVMAWLLLQKAAAAREIEEQEPLKPENRLGGRKPAWMMQVWKTPICQAACGNCLIVVIVCMFGSLA